MTLRGTIPQSFFHLGARTLSFPPSTNSLDSNLLQSKACLHTRDRNRRFKKSVFLGQVYKRPALAVNPALPTEGCSMTPDASIIPH